ncbi:Ubiquitin-conjugating enzyme family protein [Entamoeba marina]
MSKRINGEFAKMQKNNEGWFTSKYEDDIYKWKIIVDGPIGTPYEGGKFELKIELPKEYPHKPPALYVQTKVYSPIINPDDKTITASILQSNNHSGNWSPTYSVYDVILVFRTMLGKIDVDRIEDPDVAHVFISDPEKFKKIAKEYTEWYAK